MQHASPSPQIDPRYVSTVRQPMGDDAPNDRLTQESRVDRQFMEMLDGYRHSGGLARAQEVFTSFKSREGAEPGILARWIVKRSVISFDWQSKVWIPLFQFSLINMELLPGVVEVLTVLNPVFEPWELAYWFAQPSRWLDSGRRPADVIGIDKHAVLRAACADRFIAD